MKNNIENECFGYQNLIDEVEKEQEKIIDKLRSDLAKEKQVNANTGWVEHDDKSL